MDLQGRRLRVRRPVGLPPPLPMPGELLTIDPDDVREVRRGVPVQVSSGFGGVHSVRDLSHERIAKPVFALGSPTRRAA